MFIGRRKELDALSSQEAQDRSNLLPIYGRRRIGKSELILHFMRGKAGLYFLGQRAAGEINLRGYCQVAAETLREPLLCRAASWEEALRETVRRWRGKGKLIICLDEFQWIAQSAPELTSVIQGLWDRDWQRTGRVMLLLCGSQVGFMEREVLGRHSPLFGRRTGQIHLLPFNHLEAAQFHPELQVRDKALIYFVTGGVAYYLGEFEPRSVAENLRDCFLDQHSVLAVEPEFLLREELREVGPFYSILMAIAGGASRFKEIAQEIGADTHNLNYYLKQLEAIGYVGKRFPVCQPTPPSPASRRVAYEITDGLLRFWFHFIFPQESRIRAMSTDLAFHALIQPALASYWGNCFERFCRENLPRLYAVEGINWAACGEYWDKQVQIDVVGIRKDEWTDLGECRWGRVPSLPALQRELAAKASLFPNKLKHSLGLRLFVQEERPGRRRELENCKLHTLNDLYDLKD